MFDDLTFDIDDMVDRMCIRCVWGIGGLLTGLVLTWVF